MIYVIECYPMVSCWSFVESCLLFESLSYFEFVYDERVCSQFIALYAALQLSQHHLLNKLCFSHCTLLPSVSKINWLWVWGFICGLSILFRWIIYVFVPVPWCFDYYTILIFSEVWKGYGSSHVFFALRISLGILGFYTYKFYDWLF